MKPGEEAAFRLGIGAIQALARGDSDAARKLAQQLIVQRPNDANANQVLGVLALSAGDHVSARRHLERADAAAPNHPPILNALGVATRSGGDAAAARRLFERAGALGLVDAWRNLGNLEMAAHNDDVAIAAYENAVRIQPKDAQAHAVLAQLLERGHDLARAKASAELALTIAPDNEIARMALARVWIREGANERVGAALAPVTKRGSPTNRAVAWGLIGEALEKLERVREAFAAFTQANQALLQQHGALRDVTHSPYHPGALRRLAAFATRVDVSAWRAPADDAPAPIFLVGFPRSGTTLLDQILSSHSRFLCLEEKECLEPVIADLAADEAKLVELTDNEIVVRRAAYRRRLAEEAGDSAAGRRIIDKLPLNVVFLPVIRRIFPEAKIIFAQRDPRDVVLSCFQQRFGMNTAMVQFLELETAAAYYDAVMRLFTVCQERLGQRLHIVRYEDVVADLESAARALAAFLDAPYEPAMLAFRETAMKRAIGTPSARQVIEPLYARSIGRWKRYSEDLAPVLPTLNAWAVRLGYET